MLWMEHIILLLPKKMMYHMFSVCFQVLGIPWDIDTEGLRQYMLKFGDLDDVIVMKVS